MENLKVLVSFSSIEKVETRQGSMNLLYMNIKIRNE